jgi:hypothetical protein
MCDDVFLPFYLSGWQSFWLPHQYAYSDCCRRANEIWGYWWSSLQGKSLIFIPGVLSCDGGETDNSIYMEQDIATFFLDVVNSSHTYATGGTSVSEFW